MGLRPTQSDEKQLLSSNDFPWKRRLFPLSSRRSEAQWRDLRFLSHSENREQSYSLGAERPCNLQPAAASRYRDQVR